MYKITYQLYAKDYLRKRDLKKTFQTLEEINDWIVKNYYYREYYCMGHMCHSEIRYYGGRISFISEKLNEFTNFYFCDVWIEMIESENGIVYSNGEHTQGIQHISKEVKEAFERWKKEDKEDPKHLKRLGFKFAD